VRNRPVNLNDSYWKGMRAAWAKRPQGPKPSEVASGTPMPGGGCFASLPNGDTVTRFDVNCDGKPTPAAAQKSGGTPAGGADPYGQKIRSLMGVLGR
jgi:hypothetical protein